MTYPTGHEDRLNWFGKGGSQGKRDAYAREELVAELSAALMGYYLGMETTIRPDHAAYLKHWLEALHKENGFLMDVLSDVVQALRYICIRMEFNPFGDSAGKDATPARQRKEKVFRGELVVVEG